MTSLMVDMFLRSQGLTDEDIALINQELPDIDNLIAVTEAHVAQMNRVLKLLPVVRKIIAAQRSTT